MCIPKNRDFYIMIVYHKFIQLFIEASRSAIFNYHHIDHLKLLDNGLIDAVNQRIQISRRNIKNLKERLGI